MGLNQPTLGDPEKVLMTTLGANPADVAENVIVSPFIPLKNFLRHVDGRGAKELAPRFFYKGFTAKKNGAPVTVVLTGIGPSCVGDLVSLLSLTPAKRVLFAGAVGGLKPTLHLGQFLIPAEAADGEGYSRYAQKSFSQIIGEAVLVENRGEMGGELERFLNARGHLPARGRVFTIGSIAHESRENLSIIARQGFDALEMELSAFYSAANHHGLDAAALTYVSDLPLTSSLWEEKTAAENEKLSAAWRLLPELCVEFMGG